MDTRTVVDPSTVVVRGLVAGVVSGSAVGALLGACVLFGASAVCGGLGLAVGRRVVFGARGAP